MSETASRITLAPTPVFQSFVAGQRTFACASRSAKRTISSARSSAMRASCFSPRGCASSSRSSRALFSSAFIHLIVAFSPEMPCAASAASFFFSSGSSSSNSRAVAKPSDAPASPAAHTSASRCSASSRCWMPSS